MGTVFVCDLRVRTVIGVEERERKAPQEVVVNLDLDADLDPAAATDDLTRSVDYAAVAALVQEHAAAARFRLLEALAGSIAALVLGRFPLVRAVAVRIEKPGAVAGARSVGIDLRRSR